MKTYTGNKSAPNLANNILSIFPPHSRYVELFAGSAQIAQKKKHVDNTLLVDKYVSAIPQSFVTTMPGIVVIQGCAIQWLRDNNTDMVDTLIYADPPYIISERLSKKKLYKFELTDQNHIEFLNLCKQSAAKIVISHYKCALYDRELASWEQKVVKCSYRGSVVDECIYYNFAAAGETHTTTFSGKNKTDRQRIKRKAKRWLDNFERLPTYEQQAILEGLKLRKY